MTDTPDRAAMARAAWLYHVAGLTQEEVAGRMGLTRARVNRLLSAARENGVVSVSIDAREIGLLPLEESLRQTFGLDTCIATPALGLGPAETQENPALAGFGLRAVGTVAAGFLRAELADRPEAVVGLGWGRTLAHMARQMSGARAPGARFVSLMGSLTANAAFNPLEVVHALAQSTGGTATFLPVPFLADSPEDRETLLSQRSVRAPLSLARDADLALISVGELTEGSLLRQQGMITSDDLAGLRKAGAVGDTNGIFFGADGAPVDHPLNRRSLAVSLDDMGRARIILLCSGPEKAPATLAFLRSGRASGLIADGDAIKKIAALASLAPGP
jgi:DNA-binding transcriptional regulator LsrR (DeoR family)